MLTEEQEEWISHLNDEKKVEIFPYNPKTKAVFFKMKEEIKRCLGNREILHCGSTALGIPGQGEIDLYIPVFENEFDYYLDKLIGHFGKAGSIYPLKRARFVKYLEDTKIEIFLMNKETDDWKNHIIFENYLSSNSDSLEEYKKIKEDSRELSIQKYYRKKLEFINKIINKCHESFQQEL